MPSVSRNLDSFGSSSSSRARFRGFKPEIPKRSLRRPTREQGRALEMLAHAIEYLVDSDLHAAVSVSSRDVSEASAILMARSRAVFAECREAPRLGRSLQEALTRMFGRPVLTVPSRSAVNLHPDSLAR